MLSLLTIIICFISMQLSYGINGTEVIAGDGSFGSQDGVGTNANFENIERLTLSRDDSFALVVDQYVGIRSVNLTTYEVKTIVSLDDALAALEISNDGTFAVYSKRNHWVYTLDLATNSVVDSIEGYNVASDIVIGPDDSYILCFTEEYSYITKIDFDANSVSIWAGQLYRSGSSDGIGTNAIFDNPSTGAFNSDFSILYILDYRRVRKIIVSTVTVSTMSTISVNVPHFMQILPGDTTIVMKQRYFSYFYMYDISTEQITTFSMTGTSFGGGCASDGSYCLFPTYYQVIKYFLPTSAPTSIPTFVPSAPTSVPTGSPIAPSSIPTGYPSAPSSLPTGYPSGIPSCAPSSLPTGYPSGIPSCAPSSLPTGYPSGIPSCAPSSIPTGYPSGIPSCAPSSLPTGYPSCIPSCAPSSIPTGYPSVIPSCAPRSLPTGYPSCIPSCTPSSIPTGYPSGIPTTVPSMVPTSAPSLPIFAGGKQVSSNDDSAEELSLTVVVFVSLGGLGIVAGAAWVLYTKAFSYTKVNPTSYVVEP